MKEVWLVHHSRIIDGQNHVAVEFDEVYEDYNAALNFRNWLDRQHETDILWRGARVTKLSLITSNEVNKE